MLLKIRDSYAKDELVIPPENIMRWYQQDNTVDIYFKDGESNCRYTFPDEQTATKFSVDLATGYRMARVTNHVIYCTTVPPADTDDEQEEETKGDDNVTVS